MYKGVVKSNQSLMLTLNVVLVPAKSDWFIPFALLSLFLSSFLVSLCLMSLHACDSPGAPRTADQLRRGKLPLKVRTCGRREKGSDGEEESSEGGRGGRREEREAAGAF